MKPFLVPVSFIALTFIFSCEGAKWPVKCKDCLQDEPTEATIEAKIDPFELSNFVTTIKLWEGTLEDSIMIGSFEAYSENWIKKVRLNKIYTVTATYYNYGTFYTAVGSVMPRVTYEKNMCENPCYYIYDTKLDLRIKYH